MHFEVDGVAARIASAAVPNILRGQDRESVAAAADGARAD
jgi:hypothetical protein